MKKWFKFALLYIGAFVISISQFKIAPPIINDLLVSNLGVSITQVQLLSSIFAISGIFLALPGGVIMSKIGPKKLAVLLMGCLALGNVLGFIATGNYYLLLVTRVLEGISFAMFLMIAMVYIRRWFADSGSGLALGIFGTYSALAQPVILGIAQPIVESLGYQSLWLIIAFCSAIVGIAFAIFFENIEPEKTKGINTEMLKKVFTNKGIYFLALCHGAMTFILFTYLQYGPKILEQYYDASLSEVTSYMSVFGLAGIVSGIVAGIVIDKTQKPAEVGVVAFLLMALYWLSMYAQGVDSAYIVVTLGVCLLSTVISFAYTSVMILASGLSKNPEVTGYNVSIVNTVYYAIIVLGAPLTTSVISTSGFGVGFGMLFAIAAVGMISMLIFRKVRVNE